MLPTRDPPQNNRPTQTESEGLKKKYSKKLDRKKNLVEQYLYQKKIDFKTKPLKEDPEDHFKIRKGRILQEDINIFNIYTPKIGAHKIHKENLGGLQETYR